ncbi:MAG TPA: hypothetical protein VIG72_02610 [Pontibacter sp.]
MPDIHRNYSSLCELTTIAAVPTLLTTCTALWHTSPSKIMA